MIPEDIRYIADAWWARDFDLRPDQLRPNATHVQEHAGELEGSDGIWILAVGEYPLISMPPSLFPLLGERATKWSRSNVEDSAWLCQQLKPAVVSKVIGPAFIGYMAGETLKSATLKSAPTGLNVRLLTDSDWDAAVQLQDEVTPEEWEHGGSDFGHDPTFGAFDEAGRLAALAGYETWGDRLAHIAIVTAGNCRGQGYGVAAYSLAAQHAIDAGLIPQHRTLKSNKPSIRIAEKLGFEEYGISVSVRLA